jgi:uncharacterized protein (DUF1800 family)
MSACNFYRSVLVLACGSLGLLAGCATPGTDAGTPARIESSTPSPAQFDAVSVLNRLTWGANVSTLQRVDALGLDRYLDQQLHPIAASLPGSVQAQISALTISQRSLESLTQELEQLRKDADAHANDDEKKIARQAYQQELNRLAREAATRSLLRALYSPNQLQEQMTWFWMNHFNVYQGKHNVRALVGDYEERAIRPHALGKFRDLLSATVHHPAMLRYLDNEQNAVNHLNENYARELMELHTLGVTGGYSQRDVQELARILTGVGVNLGAAQPKVRRDLQAQYLRQGLFEFNPNRHDYGDKQLLGQPLHGRGLAELDEAVDWLSRHPATAHFICNKLAVYFVSDDPPAPLVERMSQTFLRTDGDIAQTLRTLLTSPEFALSLSLGSKFKDPVHYVVAAIRLAYDDKPILNAAPMLNWLNRMGEPLYGRQTPDGYPLVEAAWASPGQITTRFEIAKAIGSGNAGLFKTAEAQPQERPALPQLANSLYFQSLQKTLSPATRQALDQAGSQQEWNTFLLSSPEMMHR